MHSGSYAKDNEQQLSMLKNVAKVSANEYHGAVWVNSELIQAA
jgi:hypothetical protein